MSEKFRFYFILVGLLGLGIGGFAPLNSKAAGPDSAIQIVNAIAALGANINESISRLSALGLSAEEFLKVFQNETIAIHRTLSGLSTNIEETLPSVLNSLDEITQLAYATNHDFPTMLNAIKVISDLIQTASGDWSSVLEQIENVGHLAEQLSALIDSPYCQIGAEIVAGGMACYIMVQTYHFFKGAWNIGCKGYGYCTKKGKSSTNTFSTPPSWPQGAFLPGLRPAIGPGSRVHPEECPVEVTPYPC